MLSHTPDLKALFGRSSPMCTHFPMTVMMAEGNSFVEHMRRHTVWSKQSTSDSCAMVDVSI